MNRDISSDVLSINEGAAEIVLISGCTFHAGEVNGEMIGRSLLA